MNLIERARKIITNPKEEWAVINQETTTVTQLLTGYFLILALIPAIAQFVRYGLIGYNAPLIGHISGSVELGVKYAVIGYITYVLGAFLSAFIIDVLATSFGSQKNFTKAMQLVVYSYTPMMIASVFGMIPGLSILAIVGLYGLYLLYAGLTPMMQTPEDKAVGYFVVSLLVIIVSYFIIGLIFTGILLGGTIISAI
jgi:Yip1 domain.